MSDSIGAPLAQRDQDLDVLTCAETSLDISCPVAVVFTTLGDLRCWPDWAPTWSSVTLDADAGAAPGQYFHIVGRQDLRWDKKARQPYVPGAGLDFVGLGKLTVVECPSLLRWEINLQGAFLPGGALHGEVVLEAVTAAITTVRFRQRLRGEESQLLAWLEQLRAQGYPLDVLQRQTDRTLHNARSVLEGRA